jgi:DNA replication and repair protein RecF
MKIIAARVLNFRNLEETELTFSSRVNLFLGENGQGKTNLLEALNYMAFGRSHRAGRGEELIRFDADNLHVALQVQNERQERVLFEYGIERGGGSRLKVAGQALRGRVELVGQLATVFFSPDSVRLVRGAPERRRRFVDQGIVGLDRRYLTDLQAFQRALRQKTSLLHQLKTGQMARVHARRELEAWNREMARYAVTICQGRREYSGQLTLYAAKSYKYLADGVNGLEFLYAPKLSAAGNPQADEHLERDILAEFDYIVEDEMRRGRPLSGPQMDDFEVRLNGLDLRVYGSQGETRTAAVSLIVAQSDVVYQTRRVRPVIFFDDIFSELDRKRSRRLREMSIRDHQVFMATARRDDVAGWRPEGLRVWDVERGKLTEVA